MSKNSLLHKNVWLECYILACYLDQIYTRNDLLHVNLWEWLKVWKYGHRYILLTFKTTNKIKTKKEIAYILWKTLIAYNPLHTHCITFVFCSLLFVKMYCSKLTTNCHFQVWCSIMPWEEYFLTRVCTYEQDYVSRLHLHIVLPANHVIPSKTFIRGKYIFCITFNEK